MQASDELAEGEKHALRVLGDWLRQHAPPASAFELEDGWPTELGEGEEAEYAEAYASACRQSVTVRRTG